MNGVNSALLLFLAFTALACSFAEKTGFKRTGSCPIDISGEWTDEFGSILNIEQATDGTLNGMYKPPVSSTGQTVSGPFLGMIGSKCPTSLGFVVMWWDGESSTSWSGQYQLVDGKEKLLTTWIWTSLTKPEDNWKSTHVGKDTFERVQVKKL